jgi:hypothetical protein
MACNLKYYMKYVDVEHGIFSHNIHASTDIYTGTNVNTLGVS